MIIYTRHLAKLGIAGISIYPVIILKDRDTSRNGEGTLCHERIHHEQQDECLLLCMPVIAWMALTISPWVWLFMVVNPFYFWYVTEYFIYLARYRNHRTAYYSISFEKEAYGNQYDTEYLKSRTIFAWINYL